MPRDPDGLTPRQARFVRHYLGGAKLNATEAAKRAGYSVKSAEVLAYQLLQKPSVKAVIAKAQAKHAAAAGETAEKVLTDIREVIDRCLERVPVLDKKGKPIPGEWQFREQGALKGLELIGKHLAMFTDRVEVDDKRVMVD